MTVRLIDGGWESEFRRALKRDHSTVRIICPFIKVGAAEGLLRHGAPETLQVVTRFNLRDFASNVSDTAALRLLLDAGAQIRGIRGLHAKVYLLGADHAIVTSANLTRSGLTSNHEFGLSTDEPTMVDECLRYFRNLWRRAAPSLEAATIDRWEARIDPIRLAGGRPTVIDHLPDEGADAGLPADETQPVTSPVLPDAPQAFVKFFGKGSDRYPQDYPIFDEIEGSGSHYALTYPQHPWAVGDGAVMYIARMVKRPHDHRIYGRAVAWNHDPERDEASTDEIVMRDWKDHWRWYIRIHGAEFVDGVLRDGVSLTELVGELGPHAFRNTQARYLAGERNIKPKLTYARKPQVELTPEGAAWVEDRLQDAFRRRGFVQPFALEQLDWPDAADPRFAEFRQFSSGV
jgi:hypothetical protein